MAPRQSKSVLNWKPFLKCSGLACVIGTGYVLYDFYTWRQRNKILGFLKKEGSIFETHEVFRRSCERLIGYDVVVRYTFAEPEPSYDEAKKVSNSDRTFIGRFLNRMYKLYFTGELDDLSSMKEYDALSDDPRFRTENVRVFADGARSHVPDAPVDPLLSGNTTPNKQANEVIACSKSWPRGSHLYASMTIEPHDRGQSGLLSVIDSSTEQTLTKCRSEGKYRRDLSCTADCSSLLSPYLRVMLSSFAFFPFPIPGPLRVCQLGVGGGALPMFLQQHLGSVVGQLDLVDIEPAVLKAAVEKMGLEKINRAGEMRMCAEDGLVFLEKVASASPLRKRANAVGTIPTNSGFAPYDVLLIDLFVGSRLPSFLDNPSDALGFAELCRDALTPQGVAAFNMPCRTQEFEDVCKRVFGEKRVFALPCSPNSNVVYIATRSYGDESFSTMNKRHIVRRCRELSLRYQLPFDVSASLPVTWWVW